MRFVSTNKEGIHEEISIESFFCQPLSYNWNQLTTTISVAIFLCLNFYSFNALKFVFDCMPNFFGNLQRLRSDICSNVKIYRPKKHNLFTSTLVYTTLYRWIYAKLLCMHVKKNYNNNNNNNNIIQFWPTTVAKSGKCEKHEGKSDQVKSTATLATMSSLCKFTVMPQELWAQERERERKR